MRRTKNVISARKISHYARVCATHNRLEKIRYKIRDELLTKLDEGWLASTAGPFILSRSEQRRIDSKLWSWKMFAMELAIKYQVAIGDTDPIGSAMRLILDAELEAPRKAIPVLAAKPNPQHLLEVLDFSATV